MGNPKDPLVNQYLSECTQLNYVVIELECLAIVWAIQKCSHFLTGHSGFSVITDHRPLVGVFEKCLHDLHNQRLVRFRERVTDFSFVVSWQAGKDHVIADALSRAPVFPPEDDLSQAAISHFCYRVAKDSKLQLFSTALTRIIARF